MKKKKAEELLRNQQANEKRSPRSSPGIERRLSQKRSTSTSSIPLGQLNEVVQDMGHLSANELSERDEKDVVLEKECSRCKKSFWNDEQKHAKRKDGKIYCRKCWYELGLQMN